jgi:PKD repeat protein
MTKIRRILFSIILMVLFSCAAHAEENPYENISIDESTAVKINTTDLVVLSPTGDDYVEVNGTTHISHWGRLSIATTPYITQPLTFLGFRYGNESAIDEIVIADNVSGNTITDTSDTVEIEHSYYKSLIKENITIDNYVEEIGYDISVNLSDWTTLECDPINNTTKTVTTYANDSTTDINLDVFGNCIISINGAESVVIPRPTAIDTDQKYYTLLWILDKQNGKLNIGDLEQLKNAKYPVTIDPTEYITNGGFELGTFSGWTYTGTYTQITNTADFVHTGTYSAYMQDGGAYIKQMFTSVGTNTLSFWIQCYGTTGGYSKLDSGSNINVGSSSGNIYTRFNYTNVAAGTHNITLAYRTLQVAYDDVSCESSVSTPVANFTANVTSGTSPLYVLFNDTSTNSPTSWAWNFGDGGTSTSQNPTHTYTGVGTYNVSLNATNSAGSNTTTKTSYITVNKSTPTITWGTPANIIYGTPLSATQLNAGANVAGTFTYSPSIGTTLSVGSHTLNVSFVPTDSANYTTTTSSVSLLVLNGDPGVTWGNPADITYGTALSGTQLNAGATIPGSFVYTPSSGTVLGAGTQTLNAVFTPTDSANYSSASNTATLIVTRASPSAISWSAPGAITYPTVLSGTQLSASSATPGTFVYSPASGATLGAGVHTLSTTLSPTDSTNYTTATATTSLTVNQATPAAISWSNPDDISVGVALSGTQLNAASATTGSFVYTPASGTVLGVGSHTLSTTLNPTDSTNYTTATKTVTIVVNNKVDPVITWSNPAGIYYGTALSGTQLSASANVAGSFVYSPTSGTVLNAGTQTLSCTFTPTDTTNYNVKTKSVTLSVYKLVPTITWGNPASITYGTALSGTQLNAACGTPGTFTYTPPTGTILTGGTQTLSCTFTPTDTTNYDSNTASVTIVVNKLTPTITWSTPASIPYLTALSSTQLNADSGGVAGTFSYSPASGAVLGAGSNTLTVTFTPTDTLTYNSATKTVSQEVTQLTPVITWSNPVNIVAGTALSGTQLNAVGSVAGTFTYTPASGTTLGVGNLQNLHTDFASTDSTNYTVTSKDVKINVMSEPISVDFHADSVTTDTGTVNFYDDSSGLATTIDTWSWNFGDGAAAVTTKNATHTYATVGTYTVSLIVGNSSTGNTTSISKTNYITFVYPVVAAFSGTPLLGVAPMNVSFTDLSTGSPDTWLWDFGDGSTSALRNPTHVYETAGNFSPSLTVSRAGTTNSTIKTEYVKTRFGGSSIYTDAYTTSDSWICPVGVTSATVNMSGSGGAGGPAGGSASAFANPVTYIGGGGAGGGSGGYLSQTIDVVPGTVYPFTINSGGVYWGTPVSYEGHVTNGVTGASGTSASVGTESGTNLGMMGYIGGKLTLRAEAVFVWDGIHEVYLSGHNSFMLPTQDLPYSYYYNGHTYYRGSSYDRHLIINGIEYPNGVEWTDISPMLVVGTNSIECTLQHNIYVNEITNTHGGGTHGIGGSGGGGGTPSGTSGSDGDAGGLGGNGGEGGAGHTMNINSVNYTFGGGGHGGYASAGSGGSGGQPVVAISYLVPPIGTDFTATPVSGITGTTIQFNDATIGYPTAWNWIFGDGGTSNLRNPTHKYNDAGKYNVTLFAYDGVSGKGVTKTNYISIGGVYGRVYDATPTSGLYLANVPVKLTIGGATTTTTTNATGYFFFAAPTTGTNDLSISKVGFATYHQSVIYTGVDKDLGNIGLVPVSSAPTISFKIVDQTTGRWFSGNDTKLSIVDSAGITVYNGAADIIGVFKTMLTAGETYEIYISSTSGGVVDLGSYLCPSASETVTRYVPTGLTITNYTEDWFSVIPAISDTSVTLSYVVKIGTCTNATFIVTNSTGNEHVSTINSGNIGVFSHTVLDANDTHSVIFSLTNSQGRTYTHTYPFITARRLPSGFQPFPADTPWWVKDVLIVGFAVIAFAVGSLAFPFVGSILAGAILTAGWVFGLLDFGDAINGKFVYVIIFIFLVAFLQYRRFAQKID